MHLPVRLYQPQAYGLTGPRHPEYGHCDTAVALHPGMVRTALAAGFFKGYGGGWLQGTPLRPLVAAWNAFIDGVRLRQGRSPGVTVAAEVGVPSCPRS